MMFLLRLFFFFVFFVMSLYISCHPSAADIKRPPQEVAGKLTEMMIRELGITDSLQKDTLYRMHLKYVIEREQNNTRYENMQRMLRFTAELKTILTPEQYDRFMNSQDNTMPRCCARKRFASTPRTPEKEENER